MTAAAGGLGEGVAQPAGGSELVFRPVALEDLPNLEQRRIGKTAVGIALRCHHEARNKTWPHVG